jgi:hypothetical protein
MQEIIQQIQDFVIFSQVKAISYPSELGNVMISHHGK